MGGSGFGWLRKVEFGGPREKQLQAGVTLTPWGNQGESLYWMTVSVNSEERASPNSFPKFNPTERELWRRVLVIGLPA
jgi:hypothetical protein